MPPVVNLRPRVLPQATRGGEQELQNAANILLAEHRREEEMTFEEEQAAKQRQMQREMAQLRAETQLETSGTFEDRAGLEREVSGTFEDRARENLRQIRLRGEEERRGIELRGEETRETTELQFGLERPLRERALDIDERAVDVRRQGDLERFNLGLADLNQREQMPVRELGVEFLRGQSRSYFGIGPGDVETAIGLSRGDPDAASALLGSSSPAGLEMGPGGQPIPRETDAPPGSPGAGATGLDRSRGADALRAPGGSPDVGALDAIGTGLTGGASGTPDVNRPDIQARFMDEFLESDEERQMFMEMLSPEERVRMMRFLGGAGGR